MKSVIITTRNKNEFQFVTDLFITLSVANTKPTSTGKEGLSHAILMQETDRSKKILEKIIDKA